MKIPSLFTYRDEVLEKLFHLSNPEHDLLSAILIRAIEDYLSSKPVSPGRYNYHKQRLDVIAADHWLFDIEGSEPFSVMWILDHITSDAERAYGLIMRLLATEVGKERMKRALCRRRVCYLGLGGSNKATNRLVSPVKPTV